MSLDDGYSGTVLNFDETMFVFIPDEFGESFRTNDLKSKGRKFELGTSSISALSSFRITFYSAKAFSMRRDNAITLPSSIERQPKVKPTGLPFISTPQGTAM